MRQPLVTADALVAFDDELRVVVWNRAAEQLTGIPARDALGRECWELIGGIEETGAAVCHPGCSPARCAFEGRPVGRRDLLIKTKWGRRRVSMATVVVQGGESPLCIHLLYPEPELAPASAAIAEALESLTPRQRDVLSYLADGIPAKVIARQLGLSERTVRNYIREILITLRCRSQLEALAKLRRLGETSPAQPSRGT